MKSAAGGRRVAVGAVPSSATLTVPVTFTMPLDLSDNATEAIQPDGSFTSSIGTVLEQAGVIPPGTAGDVRCVFGTAFWGAT